MPLTTQLTTNEKKNTITVFNDIVHAILVIVNPIQLKRILVTKPENVRLNKTTIF